MLEYYRQNASPATMVGLKKTGAAALTTVPVRTLAVTGEDGGCIDTRLYDPVFLDENFPAGFRVERIARAGTSFTRRSPRRSTVCCSTG
jgi:hypothetical protein